MPELKIELVLLWNRLRHGSDLRGAEAVRLALDHIDSLVKERDELREALYRRMGGTVSEETE